jgi:hypothetical protein
MPGPTHNPTSATRRMVQLMIAHRLSTRSVAEIMDLDVRTLGRHYDNEIRVGRERAAERLVAGALDKVTRTTVALGPAVQRGGHESGARGRRALLQDNEHE